MQFNQELNFEKDPSPESVNLPSKSLPLEKPRTEAISMDEDPPVTIQGAKQIPRLPGTEQKHEVSDQVYTMKDIPASNSMVGLLMIQPGALELFKLSKRPMGPCYVIDTPHKGPAFFYNLLNFLNQHVIFGERAKTNITVLFEGLSIRQRKAATIFGLQHRAHNLEIQSFESIY
ncbi:hypothetical protein DFH28DRAFT_922167 [Melampsora americana]|nr:hypothetical protein DFH28DRAFT_922167 [Melampsora americana]